MSWEAPRSLARPRTPGCRANEPTQGADDVDKHNPASPRAACHAREGVSSIPRRRRHVEVASATRVYRQSAPCWGKRRSPSSMGRAALLAAQSHEPRPETRAARSKERSRAAAALSESIGIPSHLSLSAFDTWRCVSPMAGNERWTANGTVNRCRRRTSTELETEGACTPEGHS